MNTTSLYALPGIDSPTQKPTLENILAMVCQFLKIDQALVFVKNRKQEGRIARQLTAVLAIEKYGHKPKIVMPYLLRQRSSYYNCRRKVMADFKYLPAVRRQLQALELNANRILISDRNIFFDKQYRGIEPETGAPTSLRGEKSPGFLNIKSA